MTTFGHSLTGLAALAFAMPPHAPWRRRLAWGMVFIALASIPDWPLPGWGHQSLGLSHSLWVNLVLCIGVAVILRRGFADRFGKTPLLPAGILTWMGHILLDTLYGDLPGVAIFRPFSDAMVSLPVPWLKTLPHTPPPFDAAVVRILFWEGVTFAPLVLAAWYLRWKRMPAAGR